MYTVIRRYQNASELFDRLLERTDEIERLIRDVPGFVGYYLIRSGDGGASITVCESREGTEESTRVAGQYIRDNFPDLPGSSPEVIEGETVIRFER